MFPDDLLCVAVGVCAAAFAARRVANRGLSRQQFAAMLVSARSSPNPFDFAFVAVLGLLGLRIFEAFGASIDDLGAEYGRRVLRVCGKGNKVVLVPLAPTVGRAIDRAGQPARRSERDELGR